MRTVPGADAQRNDVTLYVRIDEPDMTAKARSKTAAIIERLRNPLPWVFSPAQRQPSPM